jgi:hypothetical protein
MGRERQRRGRSPGGLTSICRNKELIQALLAAVPRCAWVGAKCTRFRGVFVRVRVLVWPYRLTEPFSHQPPFPSPPLRLSETRSNAPFSIVPTKLLGRLPPNTYSPPATPTIPNRARRFGRLSSGSGKNGPLLPGSRVRQAGPLGSNSKRVLVRPAARQRTLVRLAVRRLVAWRERRRSVRASARLCGCKRVVCVRACVRACMCSCARWQILRRGAVQGGCCLFESIRACGYACI